MNNLGKTLKIMRTFAGLSQAQLAKKAKVSQSTIAHIECGQKDPSMKTMLKICKALKVSMVEFFQRVEKGWE